MTDPTEPDPFDDPSYQAFVEGAAKHCRCCSCCRNPPCDGVLAGGMCDEFGCVHERDGYDMSEEDFCDDD